MLSLDKKKTGYLQWCTINCILVLQCFQKRINLGSAGQGLTEVFLQSYTIACNWKYSNACLERPLKKKNRKDQFNIIINAGQKYCRMLQESILQSLSYHLRPLFHLFLVAR